MMLARLAPLLVMRSVRAMSKTVILVRHGAVDRAGGGVKPDGLYGGDVDVPLSARGEAEARAAAAYVADAYGESTTAVFASPMKRAVFGARRCAEACGVAAVEEREAFREVKRGAWVGRTLAEVSAAFPGEDMRRFLGDYDFRPAGYNVSSGARFFALRNGLRGPFAPRAAACGAHRRGQRRAAAAAGAAAPPAAGVDAEKLCRRGAGDATPRRGSTDVLSFIYDDAMMLPHNRLALLDIEKCTQNLRRRRPGRSRGGP